MGGQRTRRRIGGCLVAASLVIGACAGQPVAGERASPTGERAEAGSSAAGALQLYTSVTEETVSAVSDAFTDRHQRVEVSTFRAPTGELTARIASEQRAGGLRADVLWVTEPLTLLQYAADGLLLAWEPEGADAVPEAFQSDTYWGTRVLNVVIVHGADLTDPPRDWVDLTDPVYSGQVALPDPAFAGSAFAALGWLGLADEFGLAYYQALADNGAVQVNAPGEVVMGVAEGRFAAGMTIDQTARDAEDDGAPVAIAWPASGAIAVDSPIAVVAESGNLAAAQAFTEFVLTPEAQQRIADTGFQPIRDDVEGPAPPDSARQVTPDWDAAFSERQQLLDAHRAIFGG